MKTFILLAIASFILSFNLRPHPAHQINTTIDSTIIPHVLDGEVKEWPPERFEEDKPTSIKYAIDNDGEKLHIAMIIPKFPTQMKMMRQGMELFVDIKGKKKEGKGIEFPVKNENDQGNYFQPSPTQQTNTDENTERKKPDMQAIRSRYAMNMFALKLFGFNDQAESQKQGLTLEGSANIGFSWDSTDIMYIEYSIPLSLLDNGSLNQKMISIGWKLNGMDAPSGTGFATTTSTQIVGTPASGRNQVRNRPPTNTSSNSNRPSQQDMDNFTKEQYIWTKYTINLPSN